MADEQRGWCAFEGAVSLELVMRLSHYPKMRDALQPLPPKVLELCTGSERASRQVDPPSDMDGTHVVRAAAGIQVATFTGAGDKPVVVAMYKDYVMRIARVLQSTLAFASQGTVQSLSLQPQAAPPVSGAGPAEPLHLVTRHLLCLLPDLAGRRIGGEGVPSMCVVTKGERSVKHLSDEALVEELEWDRCSQVVLPYQPLPKVDMMELQGDLNPLDTRSCQIDPATSRPYFMLGSRWAQIERGAVDVIEGALAEAWAIHANLQAAADEAVLEPARYVNPALEKYLASRVKGAAAGSSTLLIPHEKLDKLVDGWRLLGSYVATEVDGRAVYFEADVSGLGERLAVIKHFAGKLEELAMRDHKSFVQAVFSRQVMAVSTMSLKRQVVQLCREVVGADQEATLVEKRRALAATIVSFSSSSLGQVANQALRGAGVAGVRQYGHGQILAVRRVDGAAVSWVDAQVERKDGLQLDGSHSLKALGAGPKANAHGPPLEMRLHPWNHAPCQLPLKSFEAQRSWWVASLRSQHAHILDALSGRPLEVLRQCVPIEVTGVGKAASDEPPRWWMGFIGTERNVVVPQGLSGGKVMEVEVTKPEGAADPGGLERTFRMQVTVPRGLHEGALFKERLHVSVATYLQGCGFGQGAAQALAQRLKGAGYDHVFSLGNVKQHEWVQHVPNLSQRRKIPEAKERLSDIRDARGLSNFMITAHLEYASIMREGEGADGKLCILLTAGPAAGKSSLMSQVIMHMLREEIELLPILVKVQVLQRALLEQPEAFDAGWNWIDGYLHLEYGTDSPELYRMLRQVLHLTSHILHTCTVLHLTSHILHLTPTPYILPPGPDGAPGAHPVGWA